MLYPYYGRESACCSHQSMPEGPIVLLDAFAECLDVSVVNPGEAAFMVTRSGAI